MSDKKKRPTKFQQIRTKVIEQRSISQIALLLQQKQVLQQQYASK